MTVLQGHIRTQRRCFHRQQREIHAGTAAVQIQMARRQLADLAEPAGQREPGNRRAPQMFQHRPGEIAHLDQCHVR